MLTIWWCVKGVIHWELLPENTTVNAIRYHTQLNKLEAEVVKQGLSSGKIYFQHDNAKPHVAKIVKEKLPSLAGNCCPTHHIRQTLHLLTTSYFAVKKSFKGGKILKTKRPLNN